MQFTNLGRTGLKVSRLCLGTMNYGPQATEDEGHAQMDKALERGIALEMNADHSGALIGFKTKNGEKVTLRVGTSFISFEQAELNLKRELAGDSFDQTMQKAKKLWNEKMGRLEIEDFA